MNRPLLRLTLSFLLAAATTLPVAAIAPADAAAGRKIVAQYADAIIGVEMVMVIKPVVNGTAQPPRERKREINGAVISADGLTVFNLSAIDPRASIPTSSGNRIEEPEFREVRLRLTDGTEIPARVVLKDEDLDLAFVAPEPGAAGARKFVHFDLARPAPLELLGTYFDLIRATKVQNRTPIIREITVTGIIEKPRPLALLSAHALGCPAVDTQGRLLGINTLFLVDGHDAGAVLLPTAAIAEIAPKATAAAAEPVAPANPAPAAAPAAEPPPAS